MPNKPHHLTKGFTLIEILLAVSIMGILAGVLLTVINPLQLQGKARDAKRVTSLKSIQTALELYRTNNSGAFPQTNPGGAPAWITITGSDTALSTVLIPSSSTAVKYLQYMPQDPLFKSSGPLLSPCNYAVSGAPSYRFNYISDGVSFVVTAQMEAVSSAAGSACASLSKWSAYAGACSSNPHCYGLESRGD